MATASISAKAEMAKPRTSAPLLYRLIGFALITLVPAVAWPLIIGVVCHVFGYTLSLLTLAMIGGVIFSFLALVAASLMSSPRSDPEASTEPHQSREITRPAQVTRPPAAQARTSAI